MNREHDEMDKKQGVGRLRSVLNGDGPGKLHLFRRFSEVAAALCDWRGWRHFARAMASGQHSFSNTPWYTISWIVIHFGKNMIRKSLEQTWTCLRLCSLWNLPGR